MRPEEIKKLLGGYAAGNLTPEEQQALFAAALEDQELFDALAREQALRDVLRDPASRAELLTALDRPPSGLAAFWRWLLRPAVARLATCAVAIFALVGVWRTFRSPAPTAFITVTELRDEPARPSAAVPMTPVPPPGLQPKAKLPDRVTNGPSVALADKAAPAPIASDSKAVAPVPMQAAAPPPPPPPAAVAPSAAVASAELRAAKEKDAAAPADLTARKEAAATQAVVVTGAIEALPLDARAIFYLNQPAPTANAFAAPVAPPSGGGGAAAPSRQARAALGAVGGVPPTQLGVRASILRGDQEVDLTTVLNAGESVRLKLIPNADGFLRVTEAGRTVVAAAVQRFKPFETPALPLQGASPKQLTITFSPTPLPETISLDAASRGNLVEPRADQGRATYVISGTTQVVLPVTLTFR